MKSLEFLIVRLVEIGILEQVGHKIKAVWEGGIQWGRCRYYFANIAEIQPNSLPLENLVTTT